MYIILVVVVSLNYYDWIIDDEIRCCVIEHELVLNLVLEIIWVVDVLRVNVPPGNEGGLY